MTKREAKRYVCRMAAASFWADLATGAEWPVEDPHTRERLSAADVARVEEAIDELGMELDRRGTVYGNEGAT